MIKPNRLNKGDKVAIVSLSSGILGEAFAKHELELGIKRLEEFGLIPIFMENSLKGIDFIKNNPEKRADDLKQAFADTEIKAIICAIGGIDTYRTLPYLLSDENFIQNVKNNPKIFLGFSDSTTNHLMLNKLGLTTFYGQSFLVDLAEFEPKMLEYSKTAFEYLFNPTINYKVEPSKYWYFDRTDYSPNAVGTLRKKCDNSKGYELLQGSGVVMGELFGGCIDVIAEFIGSSTNPSEELLEIAKHYNVFPSAEECKGKILLLESSDQKPSPEEYRYHIQKMKELGIMNNINGLIVGKPIDEVYYDEYKQILIEELNGYNFPILYNINIGHAYPHAILPLGEVVEIDATKKSLTIINSALN